MLLKGTDVLMVEGAYMQKSAQGVHMNFLISYHLV